MLFIDVDPKGWSAKDIERVAKAGLITGYADGTFKPKQNITREEMACVISRLTFRLALMDGIVPSLLPAVFAIIRDDGGLGTGCYISDQGHVLTAAHVVEGSKQLTAVDEGGVPNVPLKVLAKDKNDDLALLKADITPPAFLKVAPDDGLYQGKHIAVVGSPKGYLDAVTQGVVSHTARAMNPVSSKVNCFQTDAAINPGNSGGPAVDGYGDIVGVASWKFTGANIDNMAYCVRVDVIRAFLKKNGLMV